MPGPTAQTPRVRVPIYVSACVTHTHTQFTHAGTIIQTSATSQVSPSPSQKAQETQSRSLGWEDPLKKEMATHSSILAWKSHRQRSLEGYSPWGRKQSDTTEQLNNNSKAHIQPDWPPWGHSGTHDP